MKQLPVPTMLCRDHANSLTNDARLGLSAPGVSGTSPRITYKKSYLLAHESINRFNSRYELGTNAPRFDAGDLQVPFQAVTQVIAEHQSQLGQEIVADVVIITNARFPGGNASSTIDEIRYLRSKGLAVALVHCPVDTDLGRSISERYDDHRNVMYQWSQIARIDAKVLICRQPRVLVSHAFRSLIPKVRADHAFVVKNNSCKRSDGSDAYSMSEMIRAARRLEVNSLTFCPISQAMRTELLEYSTRAEDPLALAQVDWTPTFSSELYYSKPKASMSVPYVVGRHARDGAEKWREKRHELLQAYPPSSDFEVRILGGAAQALNVLGDIPSNWTVYEFGEVGPGEFLAGLDAFVYFPDSGLVEGFGRTIVEAMIAGVPVVVPPTLEESFGDAVLACEPRDVEVVVRRLAQDGEARCRYLEEVQRLALGLYGSDVISQRLVDAGLLPVAQRDGRRSLDGLSEHAKKFRTRVLGLV